MSAYYNEIDAGAAEWLRELIKRNIIAPGDVDERSIEDVKADDIRGYTQCHFFAGIGVWSYALRGVGWPDSDPVWTGSCPCQSFSASGKREGFSDQRHLWPEWFRLIREHRPHVLFGEQVASKDALAWLDVVSSDLEGEGYTIGATDMCAAGVGAPHIRQRLYFVADSDGGNASAEREQRSRQLGLQPQGGRGHGMAESVHAERRPVGIDREDGRDRKDEGRQEAHSVIGTRGEVRGAGFTNGFWRDADWLYCRDEKYRPVEPGTFPLAHGAPARVGRLRGYGNAICAEVAKAFIEAYLEIQ